MRGKTQKQKVLELLQAGEAKQPHLWNVSTNYRRWIGELRQEGYHIIVIYRLEGNFYKLIGGQEHASTDKLTQLPAAQSAATGETATAGV